MPSTDAPVFYPESALERHGLTPDDFDSAGCYALELDTPDFAIRFKELWGDNYEADPPDGLGEAIAWGQTVYYIGSASSLRDRLHDHVTGDRRQVGLLGVCPPVALARVWVDESAEAARDHERQRAYEWRDANDGAAVYVDGEVV